MTIYQLFVFSCVTYSQVWGSGGYTKTCDWKPYSGYMRDKEKCERQTKEQIGRPIHSDIADGRVVEQAECRSFSVE